MTVRALVNLGANVNAKNRRGETPLHCAAMEGNTEMARTLVNLGADVNAKDIHGRTPSRWAISRGHLETVVALLRLGGDIDERQDIETPLDNAGYWADYEYGYTRLHHAASEGNTYIAQTLIAAGAYIDAKNIHGETPLYLAVSNGHIDTAWTLVELGAYINSENKDGETPLHLAASERSVDMARTLIAIGADVDAENERGATPLHLAASEGNTGMARLLVEAGADVDASDAHGRTPLHCVAWGGYTQTARALIDLGARVSPKDIYGHTPLYYADLEGDWEMARTLDDAEVAHRPIVRGPDANNIGSEPTPVRTGIDNGGYGKSQESESGCGLEIAAIAVALIGAYFLIDNFGIWGFVWRSALIIPGLWLALDSGDSDGQRWFGIALMGGGVFFSLITLDTTLGWIVGLIWAVALTAVSSLVISRARQR